MKGVRRLALALVMGLSACGAATPTPYQPALERFGYRELQLEDDRWRVSFAGNSATSRQAVDSYLLYRAAELTVATGNDWFQLAREDVEVDGAAAVSGPRVGIGTGSGGFGVGFSTFLGGATAGDRYTAYADVLMGQGEKPAHDPRAYDAGEVLARLAPEIGRPGG